MRRVTAFLFAAVMVSSYACGGSEDTASGVSGSTVGAAGVASGKGGGAGASGGAAGHVAGFPGAAGAGANAGAAVGGGSGSSGMAGGAGAAGASAGSAGATAGSAGASAGSAGASGAVSTCLPQGQATTNGGGRCADLAQAWTARGINVGYYAFRATREVLQYSGDYGGTPDAIFTAGGATKGVVLQKVPAGAYIGLSSTGPWYDPPSDCLATACGTNGSACKSSAPPLRAPIDAGGASYVWGYAYSGGSHMQGWFVYDAAALEFAGFDPDHPCARGPAGLDFEVDAACGKPTSCKGSNISCGQANPCDEGADDCGSCGAMSGGPVTPSAWKRTVGPPSGTHACSINTPHPSIKCFANGSDPDFFLVYPFGAYLYWAQNSTTKHWLHHGDGVQVYFHTRDAQGVLWDFVEVLATGAPSLTPASDGAGAPSGCTSQDPSKCTPCKNGGTCGWIQDVFLK